MIGLFIVAGIWLLLGIDGLQIEQISPGGDVLTPLVKSVVAGDVGWRANFLQLPLLWSIPLLAITFAAATLWLSRRESNLVFIASALCVASIILTAAIALFPFLMPSSRNPDISLTPWDATSSQLTLELMLAAALVFVPIILLYTTWCYRRMHGRVSKQYVEDNSHSNY